ncbi:hypothetical protein BKK79_37200 (plasmid) [Cupriavidus sp. USMAA2-4]|uniref:hypothetical protein n=1 Tax=Cupriavidus sp. USMAA2-4 TaxID=876364 RepID=UPI0008A6E78D|nr:hypothetical protein [Cupriavidus sp. USMAA2-4]AOY97575.1 hypothetical protein BKK79_37200 [Cupriavidus sp. USMAA2-4]
MYALPYPTGGGRLAPVCHDDVPPIEAYVDAYTELEPTVTDDIELPATEASLQPQPIVPVTTTLIIAGIRTLHSEVTLHQADDTYFLKKRLCQPYGKAEQEPMASRDAGIAALAQAAKAAGLEGRYASRCGVRFGF